MSERSAVYCAEVDHACGGQEERENRERPGGDGPWQHYLVVDVHSPRGVAHAQMGGECRQPHGDTLDFFSLECNEVSSNEL